MIERLLLVLVRIAGPEPHRVLLLRHWFARALEGRMRLEQERRLGPGMAVDMKVIRVFIGMMAILYSIGLSVAMVFLDPVLPPWILAALHALVVVILVASFGHRTWLGEDDVRVIGWWPISMREAMLARTGMLIDPVVKLTLAFTSIPLLTMLAIGKPPVVAGLAMALGILLQTAWTLVLGLAVAITLLARLGAQRARRWYSVVYVLIALGSWSVFFTLPGDAGSVAGILGDPPWGFVLTPAGWFASWGGLLVHERAWVGALAGLAAVVALALVTLRTQLAQRQGERLELSRASVGGLRVVRIVESLLWPFAPGREGWIVRRLTAAHLREDPYATAAFALAPLILLAELASFLLDPVKLSGLSTRMEVLPVRASVAFPFLSLMLALVTIPQLVYSTHARAAWCIAVGELDPRSVFSAQRAVARGLVAVPMLGGLLALHLRAGTTWTLVLADLTYAWLLWELGTAIVQQLYPILPFSRDRVGGGQELLPLGVLITPAGMMCAIWAATVYELSWIGRACTWVGLSLLTVSLHRRLVRRVHGRLPIEI